MVTRMYTNPASAITNDVLMIRAAKTSIDFAAYALTEPATIEALRVAVAAGIPLRLYLDRTEIEAEAHHDEQGTRLPIHCLMALPTAAILVKHSTVLMHLKGYCIDSAIVRAGSANFSPLGETAQDNEASWDDDPQQVSLFESKFKQMWERTDNLTVGQAIALNRAQGVIPTHPHSH